MLLKIETGADNEILRKISTSVENFDEELRTLIANMQETMHAPDAVTGIAGIGLAAPQVGILRRVVLVTLGLETKKSQKILAMINPEITEFSKNMVRLEEGCLSLPNIFEKIVRPTRIRAQWQDVSGNLHEKKFSGWESREIQHEIDHLNGILFIDHLKK